MHDSLFTVICDYDGGTYISQHRCEEPADAVAEWAAPGSFLIQKLKLSPEKHRRLQNDLAESLPVSLDDTTSIWCSSARLKKKLLILHIVKTAKYG